MVVALMMLSACFLGGSLDEHSEGVTVRRKFQSVRRSFVRSLIFANNKFANSRKWRFNTLENPSLDVSLVSTGRMLQVNYLLLVSIIENHFIRERTPLSLLLLDGFRSTAV